MRTTCRCSISLSWIGHTLIHAAWPVWWQLAHFAFMGSSVLLHSPDQCSPVQNAHLVVFLQALAIWP